MIRNRNFKRAWIFFFVAMISVFYYFSNPRNKEVRTIDEFALMVAGASLATGFSALVRALRDKNTIDQG